ncbi:hypothetical protein CKY10_06150 [Photorhabdus sp. HUG-39]|nr:hypothetical protein CKY10_06150 [Photorhabdus sp. HUG-39]
MAPSLVLPNTFSVPAAKTPVPTAASGATASATKMPTLFRHSAGLVLQPSSATRPAVAISAEPAISI